MDCLEVGYKGFSREGINVDHLSDCGRNTVVFGLVEIDKIYPNVAKAGGLQSQGAWWWASTERLDMSSSTCLSRSQVVVLYPVPS